MPRPMPPREEIPPPPGEPLRIYSCPDLIAALYEDGWTSAFKAETHAWSELEQLWPNHWKEMVVRGKRDGTLTDAGRRFLGLPVAEQMEVL